ncbi:phosphotransferase [Actinopolymorpha sp. B17G11]|uniref:phosphotransferase enzyme family protein n=1 Tax=Actinopolymorpha sp. B17G11 TaxID=3160861 RepID=UPI0032E37CB4
MNARMRRWWQGDPASPEVTSPDDPDLRRLLERVAPGSETSDLGGCFCVNVRLPEPGLVVRVQPRFVSRQRVLALQDIRRQLARRGLLVGTPRTWRGRPLLRCRGCLVELETYVPHAKPEATCESYTWMFRGMGRLHRELAQIEVALPRPVVSTYAPPGSLHRWLPAAERAVAHDPVATDMAALVRRLLPVLRRRWVPASVLPRHLIHGDVRLGNIGLTPEIETPYLDFGFAAVRPRIHELAYALAWVILRPDGSGTADTFCWDKVPALVEEYEDAAGTVLTPVERKALTPYIAAVPLYHAATVGFHADPVAQLRDDRDGNAFLRISEWLLANPAAPLG